MSPIPKSQFTNLRHVALFGKKSSGKTSMFKAMVDSPSISPRPDVPHVGICDLGLNGKAVLIDTAGLNSTLELEDEQMKSIRNIVRRADVAIYTVDIRGFDRAAYERDLAWMNRNRIPHLLVFNKCDVAYIGDIAQLKMEFPQALFLSVQAPDSISLLRARIDEMLHRQSRQEPPLLSPDLVKKGDFVVLVVPDADEKAIRNPTTLTNEFLHHGVLCVTCRESELELTLQELPHIDLVVAYARSFDKIRKLIPDEVRLTSYAMLYGRQKGDLALFAEGARALHSLTENSRVLIAEGCQFNAAHHDIGHVKIPRELRKTIGENLRIDYSHGLDLPEDITKYDLVVHCAGCSMSRRTMQARIAICREAGIPIANFGTLLAELSGVLDRCMDDINP
ncbi:MAG: 50S ribosome-binding GTPase [Eubacteriales bacterium]|nr:50S ribosome-binding GTPase [Eubacteriales bacterium]